MGLIVAPPECASGPARARHARCCSRARFRVACVCARYGMAIASMCVLNMPVCKFDYGKGKDRNKRVCMCAFCPKLTQDKLTASRSD